MADANGTQDSIAEAVPPLGAARSPVPQESPEGSRASPAVSHPVSPRIRRGFACVACRDAKVKCSTNQRPNQPCGRCAKLELKCFVDRNHKRTTRRSKLEELAAEVRNIKEAVVPRPFSDVPIGSSVPPPLASRLSLPPIRPLTPQPLVDVGFPASTQPFWANTRPFVEQSRAQEQSLQTDPTVLHLGPIPEPRALGSRVFSGEDIEHYFRMYFDHFHTYLPIVRVSDPDTCYERGPVLFWSIILTASRRFPKDDTVFQFLADSLLPQIWNSVSQPPLRLCCINALLLLSTWPFPSVRFVADPSLMFAGIAMNSSLLNGLHTGRGSHQEFSTQQYQQDTTDEEATYTWAGCNIMAHKIAVYMGCPTAASLFNQTVDKIIDGTSPFSIPRYMAIHLECSRFSSRVNKTMAASLEEAHGVSHHLVIHLEEEFTKLQRLLYPDNSDLNAFSLLSTLLDVQIFFFMPLPGFEEGTLKRNIVKCYNTAESLINTALRLHQEIAFLHFAPHFVFRTLLNAVCVVLSTTLLPWANSLNLMLESADSLVKNAIRAMRACSVQDNDLHIRGSNLLEKYWEVRNHLPRIDVSDMRLSVFTHRLGAGLMFDSLKRWRKNALEAREASNTGGSIAASETPYASLTLAEPDPLQRIDWSSFMDDFDWSFTSHILGPAMGPL